MRQLIWRAVRKQCLRRRSLAALVLLVVFLLAPQFGQPSLDRLQAWTAWLEAHAMLLLLWRLCLYGLTAWGCMGCTNGYVPAKGHRVSWYVCTCWKASPFDAGGCGMAPLDPGRVVRHPAMDALHHGLPRVLPHPGRWLIITASGICCWPAVSLRCPFC